MAIRIDVVDDDNVVSVLRAPSDTAVTLVNTTTPAPVLTQEVSKSQVLKVMAGLPGLQNVFVGPTPPENPTNDTIWINTNAG